MKKEDILNLMREDSAGKTPDVFDKITSSAQNEGLLSASQAASLGAAHGAASAGAAASAAAGGTKVIIGSLIAALAVTAAVGGTIGASLAVNYAQQGDLPVTQQPVDPNPTPNPPNPPILLVETEGLEYEQVDGGYAVKGIGEATDKEIVIPKAYNGQPVVKIAKDAFKGNSEITSVTVQDSVLRIDIYAFYNCSALEEIILPDTAISMSTFAFSQSAYVKNEANWEDGLLYIGKHLVDADTNKGFKVKSGTLTVAEDAIGVLLTERNIVFNKELLLIETMHNCTSCTINLEVEAGNARYKVINGCVVDVPAKTLILAGEGGTIPTDGSVTKIGDSAFTEYKAGSTFGTGTLVIPDCITELGEEAFSGNMGDIAFSSKLTKIAPKAFYNCLISTLTIPAHITEICASAFEACTIYNLVLENVKVIGNGAFRRCGGFSEVTLSANLESIAANAFNDCKSLKTINFNAGLTSIGANAFSGCSSLEIVTLKDGLETIGDWAFHNCTGLKTVNLPTTLKRLGASVFYGCSALQSVNYPASQFVWSNIYGSYSFNELNCSPVLTENDIYGELYNHYNSTNDTITFNDDGTFAAQIADDGNGFVYEGSWTVSGGYSAKEVNISVTFTKYVLTNGVKGAAAGTGTATFNLKYEIRQDIVIGNTYHRYVTSSYADFAGGLYVGW